MFLRRVIPPSHILSRISWSSVSLSSHHFSSLDSPSPSRKPSPLQVANLPQLTPGHAIRILQLYASDPAHTLIRHSDFLTLCHSARPGKLRDASIIATALREFRRCNRFVLQKEDARAAIEGMLQSRIPNYKVVYGKVRWEAGVFVADVILDDRTGLYFAVEPFMVERVLGELWRGIMEMQERGQSVRLEEEEEDGLNNVVRVTEGLVNLLIKRRGRPERDMKKRAKRKYLQCLKVSDGPDVKTMTLATQIVLEIKGVEYAEEKIIQPYRDARWTNGVDESILAIMHDAKKKEIERKESPTTAERDAGKSEGIQEHVEIGSEKEGCPTDTDDFVADPEITDNKRE